MSVLPNGPWQELSIDFCGPFKTGEYLLVVMDDYSRYPEVEIVYSTSAQAVFPKLDAIFARHGVPNAVRTDNGPPFQSEAFAKWSKMMGYEHRKVTPLWPRANGEVERFMRTITKAVKTALLDKGSWKQEMYRFLRHYRATPHSTTGKSPAELLFGRKIKTDLPIYNSDKSGVSDNSIELLRKKDDRMKSYMKQLADQRNHAAESKFRIGDKVLVKQEKTDKTSPPFCPEPYRVAAKNGTMITADNGAHRITRNSSFFKAIPDQCGSLQKYNKDAPTDTCGVNQGSSDVDCALPAPQRSARVSQPPRHLSDFVCK